MPYSSAAIANRFLDLARRDGIELTPMQIQKLVYFAHGWHLGFEQGPLSAEHAQAWQWGPVFPELYHAIKKWGGGPIGERVSVMRVELSGDEYRLVQRTPTIAESDSFSSRLVDRAWEVYGDMSGPALSQLSHDPNGPWSRIRTKSRAERGVDIPDELIRVYFEAKLSANATS